MKALMKLVTSIDDVSTLLHNCTARDVEIKHRRHGEILRRNSDGSIKTYYVFNHGGYGSSHTLNPGSTLHKTWKMVGGDAEVPNHKQLTGTRICFVGRTWDRDLAEQKALVVKRGGTVVKAPAANVDVVVCGNDADSATVARAKTNPRTLVVSEDVFQAVLPKPRTTTTQRKATPRLSGDTRALFSLLSTRTLEAVEQGLVLLSALSSNEVYAELLSTVQVDAAGELLRGKRFNGTANAQPYLDHALLAALSQSPADSVGAELRARITGLTLEDVRTTPILRSFTALERLEITVASDVTLTDLNALGPLPSLKTLSIKTSSDWNHPQALLTSIDGLQAPALETITLSKGQLTNITALAGSPALKKVSLNGCSNLTTIAPLAGAVGLVQINLSGCRGLTSLKGLENAAGLEHCNLKSMNVLNIDALAGKPALQLVQLTQTEINSTAPLASARSWKTDGRRANIDLHNSGDLSGLVGLSQEITYLNITVSGTARETDLRSLPKLPSIERLTLTHSTLVALDGLENLSGMLALKIQRAPLEVLAIPALPALETVEISHCGALRDLRPLKTLSGTCITFERCQALEDTDGLQGMDGVGLMGCNNVTSLQGLSGRPRLLSGVNYRGSSRSYTLARRGIAWEVLGSSDDYLREVLSLSGNQHLTSLASLGSTPWPAVESLSLEGTSALVSLEGIEALTGLQHLNLTNNPHLLSLDFSRLSTRTEPLVVAFTAPVSGLPAKLLASLAVIPKLCLHLSVSEQFSTLAGLEVLQNLISLQISSGSGRRPKSALSTAALKPLLSMPALKALKLPEQSLPARCGPIAKGTTQTTSITNFKKALAKALGVPFSLPDSKKKSAPKGLRSMVSKVKKLLLKSDVGSIDQGIALATGLNEPALWDALLADLNPKNALVSGDDKSNMVGMGRIFCKRPLKDATWMRWVVLRLLASAPPKSEAATLREQITVIELFDREGGSGWSNRMSYPPMPSLKGFTGLRKLRVLGALQVTDLSWLEGCKLESLVLTGLPELTSIQGLQTATALKTLMLGAPQLTDIAPLRDTTTLQHVGLSSQQLKSLAPLGSSTNLRTLMLKGCVRLTTLHGVEAAAALESLSILECPALTDLAALGDKPMLCHAPKDPISMGYTRSSTLNSAVGDIRTSPGILELKGAGFITDVGFLAGLESIHTLRLRPGSDVDLSPLSGLPGLTTLDLSLKQSGISLQGLENIDSLVMDADHAPVAVSALPKLSRLSLEGTLSAWKPCWPELPSLTNLNVDQPALTSLAWLNAPALCNVTIDKAQLKNTHGIGHAASLKLPSPSWQQEEPSEVLHALDGLENNPHLKRLNVQEVAKTCDLTPLSTLPNLIALTAGSNPVITSLKTTDTVTWLSLKKYGAEQGAPRSLAFLKGWSALRILVLVHTGRLEDLETLISLPSLQKIQLRGSATSRECWPDALQEKLDYLAAESAEEYRQP
ncbi:MAG: hypothetical protein P8R54_07180 [Myxococcota bacterium]|nr:hypothetical protein [Myxococcota bacterium]